MSKVFQWFISFCIILNTVTLALDKYPEVALVNQISEKSNIVFSAIFITETGLKLLGLGFKGFSIDPYNIFDCIVVIASVTDITISSIRATSGTKSVITTFRGFRLLRVFKLAKRWKRLDLLLKTISRTLIDVSYFSILLFLFMFTFALLGMELFANRVKFNPLDNSLDLSAKGLVPENNFNSVLNSFTTVFVVMTADAWSAIYFNHYRALQNFGTTFYFILLIIIGQKILLNLFLAILL